MERQGLSAGDVVQLSAEPSAAHARPFRVAGSYEPIPDPLRIAAKRHEARLHLPDLLALTASPTDVLAAETVTRVNLALRDPADADRLADRLSARLPGLFARSTTRQSGSELFAVLERFHVAVATITLAGSTAFLLALMVIRAEERRETAGILRLIGLSRRRILLGILVEGAVVAVLGALLGLAIAVATEGLFNRFFQWHYDTTLVFIRVTPAIALRCVALSVPLGVLAGLVASWSLLRREIMALVRR
jgi:putative ABC transport system permease protein